tara:strand:- start:2338 stop:2493 length:156 start_codon:yes stop_codon:yes gene_type:complete
VSIGRKYYRVPNGGGMLGNIMITEDLKKKKKINKNVLFTCQWVIPYGIITL